MTSLLPEDVERRRDAKVHNDKVKLTAAALNSSAVALIPAAIIVPIINQNVQPQWSWILIGIALHLVAHLLLGMMKSED